MITWGGIVSILSGNDWGYFLGPYDQKIIRPPHM